jgi:DNA-binding MarR family transcriptional regulator
MSRQAAERLELSVWVRLMKAHGLILRAARSRIGPDLTLAQFDVMAQLARVPRGLTAAALSRHLLVTAGNLTGIVDRLERDGLVTRTAHESDRRSVRIRLSPAGKRLMGRILPRHRRDIAALLSGVPKTDLAKLRSLLGRLAGALDETGAAGT